MNDMLEITPKFIALLDIHLIRHKMNNQNTVLIGGFV